MARKSNRVLMCVFTGAHMETVANGRFPNDYDNNGCVETVETIFLCAEGSVKATGCSIRLDADSEKKVLYKPRRLRPC